MAGCCQGRHSYINDHFMVGERERIFVELERKNLRPVLRVVAAHAAHFPTVVLPKYGAIDPSNIHFCEDHYDYRLFLAGEPDPGQYASFGTRGLWKLLSAMDKNRIPVRSVTYSGVEDKRRIDLGSMLEDQDIISRLHSSLRRMDRLTLTAGDERLRQRAAELAGEIKGDLIALCKDPWGVSVARDWWNRYGSVLPGERPDFHLRGPQINPRLNQWRQDNTPGRVYTKNPEAGVDKPLKYHAMGLAELEKSGERMAALGSLLGYPDKKLVGWPEDGVVPESQAFGRLGSRDRLDINWRLEKGRLVEYETVLRKHIAIPGGMVAGLDPQELESRMRRVDWNRDWFPEDRRTFVEYDASRSLVNSIVRDMRKLENGAAEGKAVFDKLALKYLAYTPNAHALEEVEKLKAGYEKKLLLQPYGLNVTILQAYNLLDGRSILRRSDGLEDSVWDWYAVNPAKRDPGGNSVIEPVPGTAVFNPIADLKSLGGSWPAIDDMIGLRNGSKIMVPLEIGGVKADRIVYADPRSKRLLIDKEEGEHYGLYQVSDAELYSSRIRHAEVYWPALRDHAKAMGLSNGNVERMYEEIIVRGKSFDVSQEQMFERDKGKFTVGVGKNTDDSFSIHLIEADLRKGPVFSFPIINRTDIPLLEKAMQAVDWSQDFTSIPSARYHQEHPGGNREMQAQVDQVWTGLRWLFYGDNLEGRDIAARLALRYLKDTPNEQLLPDVYREMRRKEIVVQFPASPMFTLASLYHLAEGRFAMGERMAGGGQPASREWYRLDREKEALEQYPSITLVPGRFSAGEYLSRYPHGLLETKVPLLLSRTVRGLEEGNLMPLHVDEKKFPIPILIYADPVNRSLVVDLPATLAKGNAMSHAVNLKAERMDLHSLLKIIDETPGIDQRRGREVSGNGKKKPPDEGPEENNQSRGRNR